MDLTNILLVLLSIMQVIITAIIIPSGRWMLNASDRLTRIETLLSANAKRKDDSTRVHNELFDRVRKVELDIARCHVCQGAAPQDGV